MSFGEKCIFFSFLVLWKINLSWGASRQHMPKLTNRDINKKEKKLFYQHMTGPYSKSTYNVKKNMKSYIFVIVHLWVKI